MRFEPIRLFLWGYAKDRVYIDSPQILDHLKDNIRAVIGEIQPAMCRKVIENYLFRIDVCETAPGDHLDDVVFHT